MANKSKNQVENVEIVANVVEANTSNGQIEVPAPKEKKEFDMSCPTEKPYYITKIEEKSQKAEVYEVKENLQELLDVACKKSAYRNLVKAFRKAPGVGEFRTRYASWVVTENDPRTAVEA